MLVLQVKHLNTQSRAATQDNDSVHDAGETLTTNTQSQELTQADVRVASATLRMNPQAPPKQDNSSVCVTGETVTAIT